MQDTKINTLQDALLTSQIQPTKQHPRPHSQGAVANSDKPSFSELLRSQQGLAPQPIGGELKFSAHAQTRLQSRNISLQPAQITRLEDAVQKAANKGARGSLVMMDDLAMVVSVKNRTVVTVVDKDSMKQNVFTNIDSAVIA